MTAGGIRHVSRASPLQLGSLSFGGAAQRAVAHLASARRENCLSALAHIAHHASWRTRAARKTQRRSRCEQRTYARAAALSAL